MPEEFHCKRSIIPKRNLKIPKLNEKNNDRWAFHEFREENEYDKIFKKVNKYFFNKR